MGRLSTLLKIANAWDWASRRMNGPQLQQPNLNAGVQALGASVAGVAPTAAAVSGAMPTGYPMAAGLGTMLRMNVNRLPGSMPMAKPMPNMPVKA